jgi:GntR family transcriptional regulator, transcriptional repressor for pyruvate dehydrogenase complex
MILKNKKLLTLSEQIADQIKAAIISKELNPGDKLPSEQMLADQFQVSRPTVRDAIKLLAASKLIMTKSGAKGGHFVAEIDLNTLITDISDFITLSLSLEGMTIEEVLEVRDTVELKSSYLAALRRTEDDLKILKECLPSLENHISSSQFYEQDFKFHQAVAGATHNRMIITTTEAITLSLTNYFAQSDCPSQLREKLITELYDIYEAIEAKNPDLAVEKMKQHLGRFMVFVNIPETEHIQ